MSVTLTLTDEDAARLVVDLRRLDAYVIAKSGGGIEPSKYRARLRQQIRDAAKTDTDQDTP